jgi:hypothetical protein
MATEKNGPAKRETGEGIILKERIGDDFEHVDEPREESKRTSWEYLTRYNSTSSGMRQPGGWRGRERGRLPRKAARLGWGQSNRVVD